ncbi:isochorismatase family protein [Jiangella endophytica]|uniref:isochorismatase family protein n=1 Tax=Jiangella endophytica TaxID=1623398 RepID=UPI000E34A419|nr:isochorismatase family protein [Jiangella endophytica]
MRATDDYTRAGLQGSLDLGVAQPTALIVIDPVECYTDPACPLYAGVEESVAVMADLLADAHEAGVPVVITRLGHHPSGLDASVYGRKIPALRWYLEESPYSGYIDGLAPGPRDIELVKQYPSAFVHTTLASTLTFLGIRRLLIAGLSTSGCIRATATDALQYGFEPVVVSDAVGDRLEETHTGNLFDIRAKSAELLTRREARTLLGLA